MKQTMRFLLDIKWLLVFKDLNLSADQILSDAELPFDLMNRKSVSLSIEEYFRLWVAIENAIDSPEMPLILGQGLPIEAFSPPLLAVYQSPNLETCVDRMIRFKRLIGPLVMRKHLLDNRMTIDYECLGADSQMPFSMIASELVFLVFLARSATREEIKPLSIESQIDLKSQSYKEYFGVAPSKGKTNRITFSIEAAQRPFLSANEPMWNFFESELKQRLKDLEMDSTYAGKVRTILLKTLPSGNINATDVAKKLGVTKRTLQRRLSEESTSFQKQLNHTREGLACHYLTNSDVTSAEISFLLGYDEPNSFLRAFNLWTGQTPETYRNEVKQSHISK